MTAFTSSVFTPSGSAKALEAGPFDRHVYLSCPTPFRIGSDVDEAQTGFQTTQIDFILPAATELWLYAGAVNISILVTVPR